MKIKPLGNRIVVERTDAYKEKKGGIIIPDIAKKKSQEAKVVAVGPGKIDKHGKYIPIEVKEGDLILMEKYSGTEIKIENQEYIMLIENEILGIIKE